MKEARTSDYLNSMEPESLRERARERERDREIISYYDIIFCDIPIRLYIIYVYIIQYDN